MDPHEYSLPHPFKDRAVNRDEWIDRFRAVFLSNEDSGLAVLMFLAQYWHFYDRALLTEEHRVQRQCFIDILICLGFWDAVPNRAILGLFQQPKPQTTAERFLNWFRNLAHIRTERTPLPKEGVKQQ